MSGKNVPGKVICPHCGAEFENTEPACPFCGSTYVPAAQRAYMRKLHGVRQEMEALQDLPEQETKKQIGLAGGMAVRIVLIVLAVSALLGAVFFISSVRRRDNNRKEYRWRQEQLTEWEKLYEDGKYDALSDAYFEGQEQGHDVWEMPHAAFIRKYSLLTQAEDTCAYTNEQLGEYSLTELLAEYWDLYRIPQDPSLSGEEREILQKMADPVLEEIRARFPMSAEEEERFLEDTEKHPSYVDYDLCKEYVKNHAEELGLNR